ncbi:glycine-rich extracellular protein 1 isoform X3 [Pelobates fuscus]|uniref:glycine-rich extracellular protein 1 isoform X3 n=1 Tax=Pelobates fuscus TaxID=191477 RepID=UPI002FE4F52F
MLPSSSLCLFLILSIVKGSLQGGIKPQASAERNSLYQPEYARGAAASQPGNSGPMGAKAGGKYPQYAPQGYQQGPFGLQNGFKPVKPGFAPVQPFYDPATGLGRFQQPAKRKPGFAGKSPKAGYGPGAGSYPNAGAQLGYGAGNYPNLAAQGGYGNGAGHYPSNLPQQGYGSKLSKRGYGNGNYPQFGAQSGYPVKSAKVGYGNGALNYPSSIPQEGYGTGAGSYPSTYPQQGKVSKSGYGNGAGMFPGNAAMQGGAGKPPKNGYGNGAGGYPSLIPQQGLGSKSSKAGLFQQPYANGLANFLGNGKAPGSKAQFNSYQGPIGENGKLGSLGQLPYRSQALPAGNLGYDPKAVKAGGSQSQYGPQAAYPDPAASKYAGAAQYEGQSIPQAATDESLSPSSAVVEGGYQQLGNGQSPWPYAPEESAYGVTDYYGNGYRAPL